MKLIKRLVLASQSPRRIRLLRQLGIDPDVMPSQLEEVFRSNETPEVNVMRLALEKARDVAGRYGDAIVVGADTTVVLDSRWLGKPADASEAREMLGMLSGRTHTVYTGIALIDRPSDRFIVDVEATKVTFRKLAMQEIEEYVAGGSPFDKAGGYGIQDNYGAVFVTSIEGCFYNVVGFPLSRFHSRLDEFQSQVTGDKGKHE